MGAQIVVALITGTAGLLIAIASVPINYWLGRRRKREETQDVMARYRDPLLWAVHDLRSRVRTIITDDFLGRFIVNGDDETRLYAQRHTMFAVAEYLGWVEVVRRSVGFLDLGDDKRNQQLVKHLSTIQRAFFAVDLSPVLHIISGYQRAIGELMIVDDAVTEGRGWRCIGFAEFCARLDSDKNFAEWFQRLDRSVLEYAQRPETGKNRLIELDRQLTYLVDFLDPSNVRFPLRHQEGIGFLPAPGRSSLPVSPIGLATGDPQAPPCG